MWCHFFINRESVTNPKPLMECSSDLCLGKVCRAKSFLFLFFPPERECFRRPNGRGLMVHIYGKGEETITGTLLTDFLCVTPSCVTAVSDKSVCSSCYFPWCYCVVLQYPAPVSDTLFLMRLARRAFLLLLHSVFLPTSPRRDAAAPNRQVNQRSE